MKRQLGLSEMVRRRTARASRRAARGAFGMWAWSSDGDLRSPKRRGRKSCSKHGRRGSTLLVVLAMLGMLMLLGMLYFTFATQEQHNATNFAEAAKRLDDPGDDIDAIFDMSMRQLIQGSNDYEKNSAIWGPRNSIITSLLGRDLQPYSGEGVNLIRKNSDVTGLVVDQNRDDTADAIVPGYDLREINDSPAVLHTGVPPLFERRVTAMTAPDVDYTAADINNVWLAYDGWTLDFSTFPPKKVRVVKPSFHRPEMLRLMDSAGAWVPVPNWSTAPGAGARQFRPHPDNLYVWRQNTSLTPERRFLDASNPLDAALIASLPSGSGGFPFQVDVDGDGIFNEQGIFSRRYSEDTNGNGTLDAGEDTNGNGVLDGLPISYNLGPVLPNSVNVLPEYDVDNDGDGIRDSNWMDIDGPVLTKPGTTASYIPLIAYKVVDLDSRLNLNGIGNLSGDTRTAATTDFGNGQDLHRSSMGLSSPTEINPEWGMDTHPSEVTSLTDYNGYFHTPTTVRHLANMDWWWFNKGRVEYTLPRQIHAGRYGEANRVWQVLQTAGGGPAIGVHQTQGNLFPFPGVWDQDDNRDGNEGGSTTLAGILGGQSLAFLHPLALNGRGSYWSGGNPKLLDFVMIEDINGNSTLDAGEDLNGNGVLDPPTTTGLIKFLRYSSIGVGDDTSGNGNIRWQQVLSGALMQNTLIGANFGTPPYPAANNGNNLTDDPTELTLEKKSYLRPYDEPLDEKDTLPLYMTKSDRDRTGLTSRVLDLMPGNFSPGSTGTQYQLDVAKRFTTSSWDFKTFAMPRMMHPGPDGQPGKAGVDDDQNGIVDDSSEMGWPGSDDYRAWEFNVDYDNNGRWEYPPQFTLGAASGAYLSDDPFRPQLRRLLNTEFGNTANPMHTFRLNINEFLDVERRPNQVANTIRDPLTYRPLTPHSTDTTLTTVPAASPLPAFPPTTEGEREFWARRDRQQMARDIYVMLYTFCGGNDSVNVTNTSGITVYPAKTRRQMAQFAVNVVDSLDPDNVITAFEFDHNLANGWNVDDDPYSALSAAESAMAAGEREVVFGVESQQLTFSETMWLYQPTLATNNDRTPFDETAGPFNFFQIELRSISPTNVSLASTASTTAAKGIWRIHRDDNNDGVIDGTENAMTFLTGSGTINTGALFTIASADASSVGSSSLYVDYTGTASSGGTRHDELIAPNLSSPTIYQGTTLAPEANLDLLHTNHSTRFSLTNGTQANGDFLSRTNNPSTTGLPADLTTLRLERRLNPNLPLVASNPFVTVDAFRNVRRRDMNFGVVSTQADAQNRLSGTAPFNAPSIASQERRVPLDATDVVPSKGKEDVNSNGVLDPGEDFNNNGVLDIWGASPHLNSIGQVNSMSPTNTSLFQPIFDRDFASAIELFEISLSGPGAVTRVQAASRRPPETPKGTAVAQQGQLEKGGPFTFGAAVLMRSEDQNEDGVLLASEDTNNNGIQDAGEMDTNGNGVFDFGEDYNGNGVLDFTEDDNGNGVLDGAEDSNGNGSLDSGPGVPNHFHRFLSLVEVPTRMHRQLGDPLQFTRAPAKVNLNGISDPRIYAGLLDDRQLMSAPERDINGNGILDAFEDLNGNGNWDYGLRPTAVTTEPWTRDYWYNFLISRDGIDPTSGLPLPISGVSRPFRDIGLMQPTRNVGGSKCSLEDTLLRRLPLPGVFNPTDKGNLLLETGNGDTEFLNGSVDPILRHRLLSKIAGNSTTRSNVFVVYVTIGMFECVELPAPNGAVRIGGQMDVDGDGVKDTHRAVFIIDRSQAEEAYDKGSGTFDWKKLVMAKQRVN